MTVDRDPTRFFTQVQRFEMFTRAKGCCERCRGTLNRETFHAHHKVPHEKGGRTHIDNGVALCVECHAAAHRDICDQNSRLWNFNKSYAWQDEAIQTFENGLHKFYGERGQFNNAFVVEVSPSGGKTIFSMKLARLLIAQKLIDKVIWIVPRDSIKNGFVDDAKRAGELPEYARSPTGGPFLSIDVNVASNYAGQLRNAHGIVITYHSLNSAMLDYINLLSARYRLMVVFDEAHHGADGQDEAGNEWGRAMMQLRALSCCIVAMTGTPVRADNSGIPFLTYESSTAVDGKTAKERPVKLVVPDYKFSYRSAVLAGVARRILCINVDPTVTYSVTDEESTEEIQQPISEIPAQWRDRVKYIAVDRDVGVIDDLLRKANAELDRMRRNGDSDAACLVIGKRNKGDQENSLPIIKSRILALFGDEATSVESADGENARSAIKAFNRDKSKWIVAKEMIAEGTNLPRIRIVVILRDIGNQTFYEQLVHRATRNDADDRPEDAIIIQLALPNLVRWGVDLENQVRLIWDDPKAKPEPSTGQQDNSVPSTVVQAISADVRGEDAVIIAGRDFSDTDPVARTLFDGLGEDVGIARWQLNMVLKRGVELGRIQIDNRAPLRGDDDSTLEKITSMRTECRSLIQKAASVGTVYGTEQYRLRCRNLWSVVRRRSGISATFDAIVREHPNPVEAVTRVHNACKELHARITRNAVHDAQ